jgi:hypothetical protein
MGKKTNVRAILEAKGIAIPGPAAKAPAAPKFHTAVEADRTAGGVVYDSKLEMSLHIGLTGVLDPRVNIRRQVPFELSPSFRLSKGGSMRRAVTYLADFVLDPGWGFAGSNGLPAGCQILDAKGMVTDVYALKKKLFELRFDVELVEVRSKDSIYHIKTIMDNTLSVDPQLVQTIIGGPFKVFGYQSSGENSISDMTLEVIGREGYIKLAEKSLEDLTKAAADLSGVWEKDGRIDKIISWSEVRVAVDEVRASLMKIISPDGDQGTFGKEELVQISPCILFVQGDPSRVAVLRMRKIAEENLAPLDPAKRPTKKKAKTLFKDELMGQLPAGAYLHRINLYPGKYERVEAAP